MATTPIEERIATAWRECEPWFCSAHPPRSPTKGAVLYLLDLCGWRLRAGMPRFSALAVPFAVGFVWRSASSFDPRVSGLADGAALLAGGELTALNLHYDIDAARAGVDLRVHLSVFAERCDEFAAIGLALCGSDGAKATLRGSFKAIVAHALVLESLLGASRIYLGPAPAPDDAECATPPTLVRV